MSDNKVVIRAAREGDRVAVKEVLKSAYQQYESTLSKERWAHYKENIDQSVDSDTTKARLVAELNGEVVGSVFLYEGSDRAYGAPQLEIHTPIIRLLGVSPNVRGLGVATELLRASAKLALEWGAETIHLHTSDIMDSAVRLYERLGFERAYDKEFNNGEVLVKSYRLQLKEAELLRV
ncbi:GNAT family N-acetyltransferase [Cohnella cholangitidis]|uniref:GNAT family N-acetyltransferase n=1 Tax=Cohnella cholangitidis TaxID=2598458 RepID=A0A7G5C2Y2_9BACL|nr:GNAT family N-acetyltransferase [Cohnella cholangitidis]QMV43566.1 GNAT family N-acetyltransferase [Cohnella cholangitidis]